MYRQEKSPIDYREHARRTGSDAYQLQQHSHSYTQPQKFEGHRHSTNISSRACPTQDLNEELAQYKSREKAYVQLREQFSELESKLKNVTCENAHSRSTHGRHGSSSVEMVQKLSHEISSAKCQLTHTENKNCNLRAQLEHQRKSISEGQYELQQLRSEAQHNQGKQQQLAHQSDQAQREINSLQEAVRKDHQASDELFAQNSKKKHELDNLNAQLDAYEHKIAQQAKLYDELNQKVNCQADEMFNKENTLQDQLKEVDHLKLHVQRFQSEIAQVKQAEEKCTKENDKMQTEINEAIEKNTQLHTNLQNLSLDTKHLDSQIYHMKTEVDKYDEATKKQHDTNRAISEKIVEKNKNIKECANENQKLSAEVENRVQVNEQLKQKLEERAKCVREFKQRQTEAHRACPVDGVRRQNASRSPLPHAHDHHQAIDQQMSHVHVHNHLVNHKQNAHSTHHEHRNTQPLSNQFNQVPQMRSFHTPVTHTQQPSHLSEQPIQQFTSYQSRGPENLHVNTQLTPVQAVPQQEKRVEEVKQYQGRSGRSASPYEVRSTSPYEPRSAQPYEQRSAQPYEPRSAQPYEQRQVQPLQQVQPYENQNNCQPLKKKVEASIERKQSVYVDRRILQNKYENNNMNQTQHVRSKSNTSNNLTYTINMADEKPTGLTIDMGMGKRPLVQQESQQADSTRSSHEELEKAEEGNTKLENNSHIGVDLMNNGYQYDN